MESPSQESQGKLDSQLSTQSTQVGDYQTEIHSAPAVDLIAPYLKKRVDSFLSDPDFEEFRKSVVRAAEIKLPVEIFCILGNSYGTGFFREIAPYIEQIPSIKKLVLYDAFAQRNEEILESLEIVNRIFQNKGIVAMDISHNAVTPGGCKLIFDLIKNASKLQYLWANNCGLAQNGVIHIAKAIEEGTAPLKVLSMTRNRIEVKAAEVGLALQRLTDLEELILFQNGIKGDGMLGLLNGLANCKKRRKLDLNDNWFLDGSFDKFLSIIENSPHLVELNISDCNLDAEQVAQLVKVLQNTQREWLNFEADHNDTIKEAEAFALVDALTQGRKLKKLNLCIIKEIGWILRKIPLAGLKG